LTASLQLWRGWRCPSVSQGTKHRSDLWAFDQKPSDGRSLPVAYSATGTVADQPLTLSVALLLSKQKKNQTRSHRRLVKRTTISSSQSAFRRRLAPSACFRWVVKGRAKASAIGTIHEHDRDLPNPASTRWRLPSRPASPGSLAPCGDRPAELPWIRGPTRLSLRWTPLERDCSRRDSIPRPA